MILTNENKQLLKYVHEHRLVQPIHMHQLGGWDVDYLQHRMPAMAKEKYLKRLVWQRESLTDDYAAYQLDTAGRKVLAEEFAIPMDQMRFKRTPIDTRWFRHALLTTDAAVTLRSALGEAFALAPVLPIKSESIHAGERVSCTNIPDFSGSLTFKERTFPVHLEADTGSMPIFRSQLRYQQSIYKKLVGYLGAIHYQKQRFMVLVVTVSPTRCFDMFGILRPKLQHLQGDTYRNLVLFNHIKALQGDPLGSWCNLIGEQVSLLPQRK